MKHKQLLSLSALCLFTAFLLSLAFRQQWNEALASRLSPDILRFHVLADSNSLRDQELKLEVRDLTIQYLRDLLGDDATKEETIRLMTSHKEAIEDLAHSYLLSQGKDCPVTLSLTRDYFPTKAYGDLVFPCGTYDTARLTIGSGKGRNWWCVLYPPLCYTDSIHAIVPQSSKEDLAAAVGEADYDILLPRSLDQEAPADDSSDEKKQTSKVEVRFFLLDLLTGKQF